MKHFITEKFTTFCKKKALSLPSRPHNSLTVQAIRADNCYAVVSKNNNYYSYKDQWKLAFGPVTKTIYLLSRDYIAAVFEVDTQGVFQPSAIDRKKGTTIHVFLYLRRT